jgi:hypothetical protein
MTRAWQSALPQTPMGAWLRRQEGLDSVRHGLSISDLDYMIEKFMTSLDGLPTRSVKALMFLEVKGFQTEPSAAQAENLYIHHALLYGNFGKRMQLPTRGVCGIWHFGVYVLSLPGEAPDDRGSCRWGRFAPNGILQWTTIPCAWLPEILRFTIRPDTLTPLELRRHHAEKTIVCPEQTPLGFITEKVIFKRS